MPEIGLINATDRPYQSRELTRRELLRLDIHSFYSPKERRFVRVVGLAHLAMALQREFEPNCLEYVERPRMLTVGKEMYEFSFWTRSRNGRESLPLLVPTRSSVPVSSGRRRHREAEHLLAAAEAAHLPLEFVLETELLEQGAALASHLRMLASVQLAARQDNRPILRECVMTFVRSQERSRVSHIVSALGGYLMSDVRCVICDLVHAGQLDYDRAVAWSQHSLVWATP